MSSEPIRLVVLLPFCRIGPVDLELGKLPQLGVEGPHRLRTSRAGGRGEQVVRGIALDPRLAQRPFHGGCLLAGEPPVVEHFPQGIQHVAPGHQAALEPRPSTNTICGRNTAVPAASAREDILVAWKQWEEAHPDPGDEPDFPDVGHMRSEPKPDPLAEA